MLAVCIISLNRKVILVFVFRLEFGTAAQPPVTPQSGAEKPVTPTGERREYGRRLSVELWTFTLKLKKPFSLLKHETFCPLFWIYIHSLHSHLCRVKSA